MVHLEINEEERSILLQLLDSCISDLRVEISNTDNTNYKNMLKHRKETLIKLQTALITDQLTGSMT